MAEAKPADLEKKPHAELPENYAEPNPSWTQDEYDDASWRAIVTKDDDRMHKIDVAYKTSALAQGEGLAVWEARLEYLRFFVRANPDFEKLKEIAKRNPTNSKVLYYLARMYDEYEDYASAAQNFEEAAKHAKDEDGRLRSLSDAAVEHAYAGSMARALELLEEVKVNGENDPGLSEILLSAVNRIADLEKNEDLQIAVLERKAELHPGDASCACRKSNPSVLVMQPAQDRTAKNVSGPLNGARHRRVLI